MAPSHLALQGAGHLAAALIEGFSRAQLGPISIYNRTHARARALAERFALTVFDREPDFDSEPCPLLLVIPAPAILSLPADRIARWRESGRVVISCANGLPLPAIEKALPGVEWVKAIPSVSAAAGAGVTLLMKGAATREPGFEAAQRIFASTGSTARVESDEELDRLSVITSCLPGLLAAILNEFAAAHGLDERQARDLLLESALGAVLVARKAPSLSALVQSVSNPGGLTESGVSVLRSGLPPLFAEMRRAMDHRIARRRVSLSGPRP